MFFARVSAVTCCSVVHVMAVQRKRSPLAKQKKKKMSQNPRSSPPAQPPASPQQPAPKPVRDVSEHVMSLAARHLVRAAGRRWEAHPDGCVQADILALDAICVEVVFWRGRTWGQDAAVLAVLPRAYVTLAELMDRPLAPWDVVPPGHTAASFRHGGALDVQLVAPTKCLAMLQTLVQDVRLDLLP